MEELANVAPPENIRNPVQNAQDRLNALQAEYNALPRRNGIRINAANAIRRQSLGHRLIAARAKLDAAKRNKTRKNLHNSGISEYIIIEGDDSRTFTTDIMKKMSEGYILQGGVSSIAHPGRGARGPSYMQAMVKPKEPLRNLLANNANLLNI